jgi:hypothetical protein
MGLKKNTFTFCTLSFFLLARLSQGAEYAPPKTIFGHPDLQGTFTFRTLTPMQRPTELGERDRLSFEEAEEWAAYENRRQNRDLIIDSVGGANYPPGVISYNEFWYERGNQTVEDLRTSLIVSPANGRIPDLTEAALERRKQRASIAELSLGPEARPYAERCLVTRTAGPPMQPGSYNLNVQFVQTEDHFMILNEMIHSARIVRMDATHRDGPALVWEGDSVGHWENDTLVIETKNFLKGTAFADSTASMELIERITRVGPDTLAYEFTVDDPDTWLSPWTALIPMRRLNNRIFEYACHEGNRGLHGVLAGIRRLQLDAETD